MSLFITFEGIEGSGKSIQTRILYRKLLRSGIPAILVHEPGSTPVGERLTRLLKWSRNAKISPLAELMLFNASRAQLVEEVIKPALDEGKVVICDRYTDSTIAYQGYGRGLDIKIIKNVNDISTQGIMPDLTVLLDLQVKDSLARIRNREHDRFEKEAVSFHNKVRKGYLQLAGDEPRKWLVIDASQSKETIGEIIWKRVNNLLSNRAER